jgi:uncharacterized protein (TIGR02246 family)
MRRAILPLLLLLAVACQPGAAPLSETDIAAIRTLGQNYADAILAGDAAGAAAVYADDAIELPPGRPPVEGREAIEANYVTAFEMGQATIEFSMMPVTISGVDGLAYEYSKWAWTGTPPGMTEPVTERGKLLVVARQQEDGSWLWAAAMWNAGGAPAGSQ